MKNADMPAMPLGAATVGVSSTDKAARGLTKREHFAAMAMQGILSNSKYFRELQDQAVELDLLGHDCETGKLISDLSWEYADALLAALENS